MKMLARSVLVLVIFGAALAAPTTELFNYDSEVYDAILEDVEPFYNYEQIPINQVQVMSSSHSWGFQKNWMVTN